MNFSTPYKQYFMPPLTVKSYNSLVTRNFLNENLFNTGMKSLLTVDNCLD